MSVYFASVGLYMKVGYSKDPVGRAASLTTGKAQYRPADIERGAHADLIGWFPGDHAAERAAHMALGRKHVMCEWFIDCPEVRDYLRYQDDAVLVHELSALALLAVLRGLPVADAATTYPLGSMDEALDAMAAARRAS
ncbi:GIY-YIG nuclease family protein [Aeromicrobium sp. 9AM]|uniref:GIY-YIG nuclease family protein n=1 Tax=Aeromicrobium sp. 9AM TaxID=2653126 RepID=UPI0012EEF3DD|nr:GIY-YIG nuclease family protein [Aeromicrobium sp. 9AM]VXC06763.1 hypothetical protein AERO9AM_30595 [Aeromicrobium sp. 9AM]